MSRQSQAVGIAEAPLADLCPVQVCYRLYGTGSWLWLHILRPGAIALTFSVLYFALNKQLPMGRSAIHVPMLSSAP